MCKNQIMESITATKSQSWHYSEDDGLPGITKGMADLDELLAREAVTTTNQTSHSTVQLLSTTRIPPRLWLLGEHGVFALLDSLCNQHLGIENADSFDQH